MIIALGINFISDSIPLLLNWNETITLLIGIILSILPIFYFMFKLFKQRIQKKELLAYFIYNSDDNKLLHIPDYHFAKRIIENLECLFTEKNELIDIWKKNHLWPHTTKSNEMKRIDATKSVEIINQSIEYFILNELNEHLLDYFNSENFKDKNLRCFNRSDIKSLLDNIFLDTFSKQINQRKIFLDNAFQKYDNIGKNSEISKYIELSGLHAITKDGPIKFEKFELYLPKRTSISKTNEDFISIDMKRIKFCFKSEFSGLNENPPQYFENYYLDIAPNPNNNRLYIVPIKFEVKFNLFSLLRPLNWKYYLWVDDFLGVLKEKNSMEAFFNRINWDGIVPFIKILEKKDKIQKTEKKNF